MSATHKAPRIPRAEHEEKLAVARVAAFSEGADAQLQRIRSAILAPQVRGSGRRMAAALDLLIASPGSPGTSIANSVARRVQYG